MVGGGGGGVQFWMANLYNDLCMKCIVTCNEPEVESYLVHGPSAPQR